MASSFISPRPGTSASSLRAWGIPRPLSASQHGNRLSNQFRADGLQRSCCIAVSRRSTYSHRTFRSQ
ncbi:hypothetical protein M440DRAFT_1396167 [Trichoderma longibrachiatum ATCC 18648]|uniref:Uncharacterized protein n=1 Tax=Trichoderma longibrachiatum ATCC 18648 TaxID=983965 RepID=A0A2T4CHH7_TRILO|nr:hypothetical protein M440DRAFT_1396167 [Trichoderma longibrachiatum ATCC 18648]